jgi:hypothetical protein
MAGHRETFERGLTGRFLFASRDAAGGRTFEERIRAIEEALALRGAEPAPRRRIEIRDARL